MNYLFLINPDILWRNWSKINVPLVYISHVDIRIPGYIERKSGRFKCVKLAVTWYRWKFWGLVSKQVRREKNPFLTWQTTVRVKTVYSCRLKYTLKQPTIAHIFFIIILFYQLNFKCHIQCQTNTLYRLLLLISEGCDSPYYCFGRCASIWPTIADACVDGQCRCYIPPYFTTPRPYAILWWFNKVLVVSLICLFYCMPTPSQLWY